MSYGQQGGSPSQWDPWKPHSQQPWNDGTDGTDGTPDWAALAEASEARNKRRRLLFIGGGALATLAIGAAVAVAVVSANSDGPEAKRGPQLPSTADIPSGSGPAPSFEPTSAPPPLDPKDFVSSKDKDKAPLSVEGLFPGTQLTMGDNVYKKGPTADTRDCASAAQGTLPKVLNDHDCTRLMRVSYTKDGVAVTVGVAVFDTESQATRAKKQADKDSIVSALSGGGVKQFCNAAVCRSTTNSYGRYAYFTVAGFTDGKDVTPKSTAAFTTGDDLAEFSFRQIRRRGEAQASAEAAAD
ncbi:hypothetical protein ACIQNG_01465 [Streptomyces sp. NPDC091377]|uniref:hypothetical protein n=1 Tax=Streptomyces sp. NPDC091377 TaxID=3365995 RepID=UPI0037F8A124